MTSHFKRNSSRTFFPSSSPTIITRGPLRRSGNGEALHTAIICNKSRARCYRDRRDVRPLVLGSSSRNLHPRVGADAGGARSRVH